MGTHLQSIGPLYGYYPSAPKTHLIVKPKSANTIFEGSNIQITCHGECHLGAALGDNTFVTKYVSSKVKKWTDEILLLSDIAKTYPHNAYVAFVSGVIHKWNYVMRTIGSIAPLFHSLEDVIHKPVFNSFPNWPCPMLPTRAPIIFFAMLALVAFTCPLQHQCVTISLILLKG